MFKHQLHLKRFKPETQAYWQLSESLCLAMQGSPPAQYGVLPRNLSSSPNSSPDSQPIAKTCPDTWHLFQSGSPKTTLYPTACLGFTTGRDMRTFSAHCILAQCQTQHPGPHPELPAATSEMRFTLRHPHAWWIRTYQILGTNSSCLWGIGTLPSW